MRMDSPNKRARLENKNILGSDAAGCGQFGRDDNDRAAGCFQNDEDGSASIPSNESSFPSAPLLANECSYVSDSDSHPYIYSSFQDSETSELLQDEPSPDDDQFLKNNLLDVTVENTDTPYARFYDPPNIHGQINQAESQLLNESSSAELASEITSNLLLDDEDKEYEIEDEQIPFDFSLLEEDPPLYHGAPITLHQSFVSILTLALTFQLSGVCIKGILDLIQLHLPKLDNKFKTSLQFFKDYFYYLQSPKQFEYYCSECYTEFIKGGSCPKKCENSKTCYLIKLPILDQLKTLFAREGFFSKLNFVNAHTPGKFADVYDGGVYQEQVQAGVLGKLHALSLQWYIDGAALYKSTNFSVWLTYLTINELPYNQRFNKENVIVPIIWCGSSKPPGNLVLNSIQPELEVLSGGVSFDVHGGSSKSVEITVVNGTADLPARSLMLNMKESNGANSCQRCVEEGEPRVNFPGVRLFPYSAVMVPRTHENLKDCGKQANKAGKAVLGVKGTTTLSKIVPDTIRGTAIDPMHLLSGISKKILELLLCTKASSKKWSVSSHLGILDRRLLSIKPPAHIMRMPRSHQEKAFWKMSEWLHWLTEYAVPVLYQIMPPRYFHHFCTLVAAIQLLSSDVVTEEDIVQAERLLNVYVSQLADFYSVNILTMNFHLLLHLPEVVRDLGPTWVYTCFPLENLNGIVLNLVHGTRWADRQIATSVQTCLGLPNIVRNMSDSLPKNFCNRLLNRRKFYDSDVVDKCVIIGDTKIISPIPQHVQVLLDEKNIKITKAYEVKSLKRGKFIYIPEQNNLSKRQDSSIAAYEDEDTANVCVIQQFLRGFTCECSDPCSCESHMYAVVKVAQKIAGFPTLVPGVEVPNTHEYKISDIVKIIPCTTLLGACISININSKCYISRPLNGRERE
ncbi:UDP-N-acetylmuramoyl-L-alanyl-D-glutamate--2,6-diaminopimelate ligase [Frankliniella fusca]|uniref:UDP-N-acetylmuramoyl-L-alanyl-D-glutamate--2, 6-diaminopimelate ligase n=1 Tax=Frankliniella fusca TaxID=407009 RepID=A0AAE1HLC0_9NEOP|nr:UDP-N-acetylmuramoyl-L-alanyl-D-glutamate--2,6-diaminopimelate ligase [Frankliniella fusca]